MKKVRALPALLLALILTLASCGTQEPAATTELTTVTEATVATTALTTETTKITETTAPPDVIPAPSHDLAALPRHINGGAWNTSHVQGRHAVIHGVTKSRTRLCD